VKISLILLFQFRRNLIIQYLYRVGFIMP